MRLIAYPLLGLLLVLSGCNKSEESEDDQILGAENASELMSTAQTGDWTISFYYDSEQDETSNFAGYVFTFSSEGVATANNGTNAFTGSWTVTTSDSSDDSEDDHIHFNLNFTEAFLADEINDDWHVLEVSSNLIRLTDVSGDGSTDFLTFEKN